MPTTSKMACAQVASKPVRRRDGAATICFFALRRRARGGQSSECHGLFPESQKKKNREGLTLVAAPIDSESESEFSRLRLDVNVLCYGPR